MMAKQRLMVTRDCAELCGDTLLLAVQDVSSLMPCQDAGYCQVDATLGRRARHPSS